jgi:hypothetical protein
MTASDRADPMRGSWSDCLNEGQDSRIKMEAHVSILSDPALAFLVTKSVANPLSQAQALILVQSARIFEVDGTNSGLAVVEWPSSWPPPGSLPACRPFPARPICRVLYAPRLADLGDDTFR